MFGLNESLAFWVAATVQVTGILSLILSRLGGNVNQTRYQRFYFAALFAVGGMMIVTVANGSGYWISFAGTTAVMVIGATLDLSRGRTLQATQFGASA